MEQITITEKLQQLELSIAAYFEGCTTLKTFISNPDEVASMIESNECG